MIRLMAKVNIFQTMEQSLMANGFKTTDRARVENNGQMALFLKEATHSIRKMAKANSSGLITIIMWVSSRTTKKTGMEHSNTVMVANMQEVGWMTK